MDGHGPTLDSDARLALNGVHGFRQPDPIVLEGGDRLGLEQLLERREEGLGVFETPQRSIEARIPVHLEGHGCGPKILPHY